MAVQHIIAALVEDWDRVNGLLGAELRAELHRHAVALTEADTPRLRRNLASRIVRLLTDHLPHDDPVLEVADRRYFRSAQLADTDNALFALAGEFHPHLPDARARTADERVLSARWEFAHALRGRGVDPDLPDLIRLDRSDGTLAVPAFQFDERGRPIPVVLRINQVLGSHDDPWGVADWWLSANIWLREPPSALIGRTPDDLLVAAAVAAVEG